MTNEQIASFASIAADVAKYLSDISVALTQPNADDMIYMFDSGFCVKSVDGKVETTNAVTADALPAGMVIRNGAGEQAKRITRREALERQAKAQVKFLNTLSGHVIG